MQRKSLILSAVFAPLLTLGSAMPASALVYNYFDTTFVNTDWTANKIADTTPSAAATFVTGQVLVGGSPIAPFTPEYRQTSHTYGAGAIIVSHQALFFNWTPLPLEQATSLDYTYDLEHLTAGTIGGAVGYSPAIFQGSDVFRLPFDNIFQRDWVRFGGTSIPISAFLKVDPATALLLPFTPSDTSLMGFGYVSANSATGLTTKVSGLDNFGIRLNTTIVPEPASLTALTGAALLVLRRRR
jgi:hypothetical protein